MLNIVRWYLLSYFCINKDIIDFFSFHDVWLVIDFIDFYIRHSVNNVLMDTYIYLIQKYIIINSVRLILSDCFSH